MVTISFPVPSLVAQERGNLHTPGSSRLIREYKLLVHPVMGQLHGHLDPPIWTQTAPLWHCLPITWACDQQVGVVDLQDKE